MHLSKKNPKPLKNLKKPNNHSTTHSTNPKPFLATLTLIVIRISLKTYSTQHVTFGEVFTRQVQVEKSLSEGMIILCIQ